MELWVSKVIALVIMFLVTLFLGLIPVKIITSLKKASATTTKVRRVKLDWIISLMNCVGGGVFFGTTMLHLLPEVKESIEEIQDDVGLGDTKFAVSEFLVSVGFFLVMFVEHIIMVLQHHHSDVPLESTESSMSGETSPMLHKSKDQHTHSHGHSHGPPLGQNHHDHTQAHPAKQATKYGSIASEASSQAGDQKEKSGADMTPYQQKPDPTVMQDGSCVHIIHPSHHEHHHLDVAQLGGVRSFILLLAMSIHTIFDGLVVGLQKNNTAMWNLFTAIIIHKTIIAFSLGVKFADNLQYAARAVLFVVIFSIMSPIGVAVGIALTEQGENLTVALTSAILEAFSTGIFIYVTFFEVLMKEVGNDHSLLKVLFIIIGYGIMALINLLNPEPE